MGSARRVFICGYYGFENTGDEAILTAMLAAFRREHGGLHFTVTSAQPSQTAERYGVGAVLWSDVAALQDEIALSDLVVIGGGGIFHDYFGFDPDTFLTDSHSGIAFFTGPAMLASLACKPMILSGIGVGPILGEPARTFTRVACELAQAITVRDEASARELAAVGVPAGRVEVTADHAFAFEPPPSAPKRFALAVAPRHWNVGVDPAFWQAELAKTLDLFLAHHPGTIAFLPFQTLPGRPEDDRAVCAAIQSRMRFAARAWVADPGPPAHVAALLAQSERVLGMRLHSLILGAVANVPVVALSYDRKDDEAMRRLGLSGAAFPVQSFSAPQLAAALEQPRPAQLGNLPDLARSNARRALDLLGIAPVRTFSPEAVHLLGRAAEAGIRDRRAARLQHQQLLAEHERSVREGETRQRSALRVAARAARDRERLHAELARSVDQARALEAATAAARNTKPWQLMLLARKIQHLRWRAIKYLASVPFSGWGRLADHDVPFPRLDPRLPVNVDSLFEDHRHALIVFPVFDFEFRFQRPQQIAAGFAKRGHPVFWISPTRVSAGRDYQAVPLRPNLWELRLGAPPQRIYSGELSAADASRFVECLGSVYRDFGLSSNTVLVQFPFWREVALQLRSRQRATVLYDCMDDWRNWTTEPAIGPFTLSEEHKLLQEADLVTVSSGEFFERYKKEIARCVLVRNAADFEFFQAAATPVRSGPKVVGYYGAISEWFDLELVAYLAERRPDCTFVLIGQAHAVDVECLRRLPNVQLPGEKPYVELPAILAGFDVCLIPFRLNALTRGVDPVKLYEYLSQGKPVVATDMPELAGSFDLIYVGRKAEGFLEKLDEALAEQDPELRARRIRFARENSWQARVETMETTIAAAYPKVSILIVTYNSEEFIEGCLASIQHNTAWPNFEVLVVDNASTDSTCALVEERPGVRLLRMERNLGFAAANNIAAREAGGEYLVFLNADTIVTAGWISRLVAHCVHDKRVGQVAAVTNFSGNETKIDFAYSDVGGMQRFAAEIAVERAGQEMEIPVAALYCVLMPRPVWRQVGELDEGFGLGMFEDDDLSVRVRAAGFRVIAAEDVFIHHFGNGSFKKLPSAEITRIFEENRRRYEQKWQTAWTGHTLRLGVKPLAEEPNFTPSDFMRSAEPRKTAAWPPPKILAIHPSQGRAGEPLNPQADGSSAVSIDCEAATPDTSVSVLGRYLSPTFGSDKLLSVALPPELLQQPRELRFSLVNHFGRSNEAVLRIVDSEPGVR